MILVYTQCIVCMFNLQRYSTSLVMNFHLSIIKPICVVIAYNSHLLYH